jgi:hypothetical protein
VDYSEGFHQDLTVHGQFWKRLWIHVKLSVVITHKHAPESHISPAEIVKQPNIEQGWIGLQLGYVTYRQKSWKGYLDSNDRTCPLQEWSTIQTQQHHMDHFIPLTQLSRLSSRNLVDAGVGLYLSLPTILHRPVTVSEGGASVMCTSIYMTSGVTHLFIPWWWRQRRSSKELQISVLWLVTQEDFIVGQKSYRSECLTLLCG